MAIRRPTVRTTHSSTTFGATLTPLQFTIANTGTATLNLTGAPRVSISGAHAEDFIVTQQPSSPVAVGSSTTFEVLFQPSAGGRLREAMVSIANDDSNENPYNFAIAGDTFGSVPVPEILLRGNGQEIIDGDTTPASVDDTDFGNAIVASGGATHTFTIANTGTAALNLTGTPRVSISGTDAEDFSITLQPSSPVASGDTTTFQVRFDPSAEGLRQATVSIANDDSDEDPYDFAVSGIGALTAAPEIAVTGNGLEILDGDTTPDSADGTNFGGTGVETGAVTRTFAIANIGLGALNLTGTPQVSIGGVHASDFSVAVQPSSPVAEGSETTFQLLFNPTAEGMREATISIANDDTDENPYDFAVRGAGFRINSVIDGHGYHSLALLGASGDLWAWGLNNNGQLGDGTTTNQSAPTPISNGYLAIAGGRAHSLALKNDGSLWAWGSNSSGQLGDGTTTNRSVATPIDTGFSAVAASDLHSLALKNDGSLYA